MASSPSLFMRILPLNAEELISAKYILLNPPLPHGSRVPRLPGLSLYTGLSTWEKQWEVEGTTSVTASWLLWVSARP